ncbi:unnamed protein product [Urochloa humidicola]
MDRDRPIYDSYTHPVYGVVGFVGELFLWGAAGGAAFHFARGLVRGGGLAGATRAAGANAPRVAGTFGAYCAAFSAVETAVSHARDSKDMWCSVSAFATIWGLHGMRRGGAPAAVGSALLGTCILALHGIDHWGMVWQSHRADADALRRRKQMMDRCEPTPVSLAARRAAIPHAERPPVELLFAKSR